MNFKIKTILVAIYWLAFFASLKASEVRGFEVLLSNTKIPNYYYVYSENKDDKIVIKIAKDKQEDSQLNLQAIYNISKSNAILNYKTVKINDDRYLALIFFNEHNSDNLKSLKVGLIRLSRHHDEGLPEFNWIDITKDAELYGKFLLLSTGGLRALEFEKSQSGNE